MTPLERRRHAFVVLLTLGTGVLDAVGFLHLGGAFSSVMTGNMVLLGISAASAAMGQVLVVGGSIVAYIVGVVCGAHLAGTAQRTDGVWHRRVTLALAVEAVLLVALAICWLTVGAGGTPVMHHLMLGLSALALGIQSSAIQRFGVAGLSSTYLTGTLTSVVAGFTAGRPASRQIPGVLLLCALIVGAGFGYAVSTFVAPLAPVLFLSPIAVVIVAASLTSWKEESPSPDGGALNR